MAILDLINKDNSQIGFNIIQFNDGELCLELGDIDRKSEITINCRIRNANELFILKQAGDIINRQGMEISCLNITYLMGARMDRVISFNKPFTLSLVADVINSINAKLVVIIEPHSSRSLNLIKNSIPRYPSMDLTKIIAEDSLFVLPDKGAVDRMEMEEDVVICSKVRDLESGKLISFNIDNEYILQSSDKDLFVVDDLCDAGGTFIMLSNAIKEKYPHKNIDIFVTHMVNYNGIINLSKHFRNVYITNSYEDWGKYEMPKNIIIKRVV